jgi:RNA polymerase sigma-70 factor, ECF subfamily
LISQAAPAERRELDPAAAGSHIDTLFKVACALCGSRQLAEDLVQETYVKVLARPRFLRREDDLGYLVKALRNTWYNHLRSELARPRRAPGESPLDQVPAGTAGDPHASAEAAEVLAALGSLAEPFRATLAAVDLAGLSYAEAAKALGVKPGTVMSRLHRGRDQLARALEAAPSA